MSESLRIIAAFHLQNADGKFYCFDRHGDSDREFWSEFSNAFLCHWDSPEDAIKHMRLGDTLRCSINGVLQ